jgi:acetoacetyl-CoA synthetase
VVDIPYTINGKKMENLIKNVINGRTIKSSGTAVNVECIQEYHQFEKLRHGSTMSKL